VRVVFAGIIGRYPWGGVTWCSLMYLLGLRRLGHDVYYLEDTCECNFDPEINAISEDPRYALRHIDTCLAPFGFGDRWCYVDHTGGHHGIGKAEWESICRSADLFLVLSGGCWVWRDHCRAIPAKVFIDSDPAFTQLALHRASKAAAESDEKREKQWYVDFFRTYDHLFTFGSNIGTPRCDVPTGEFRWKHTWQPICTDLWTPPEGPLPARDVWTTVMTWEIESFTDIGGTKGEQFAEVLDLARRCRESGGPEIELAVNGPRDLLREHGWRCVDAFAVSADPWRYHSHLTASRGEFSVAKRTYVETNSGWFSDRTACYLASGRPAVVQETGFSHSLPTGEGLLSWRTPDEALEALRRVEQDHERHSAKAREIAIEQFDAPRVLGKMLEQIA
jgi:hypothetical protein